MHRAALAEHGADGGAPDIVALNLTARAWSAVMWALGALGALFAYTAGAVAFALGAPVMRVELDVFRGMDEEAGGGTSLVRLEWAHAVADGATVNGFVAALADAYAADARAPRAPTPALPDGPVDPGTIRLARQLVVADGGGGLYAPTPGVGFAFRRFVLPVDVAPGADRRAALRAGFASAVARVWRLLARSARSNDSAAAIPSLRFVIDMRGAADAGRALAGNALRWGAAIAAPEQLVADVRTGAATIIAHQRARAVRLARPGALADELAAGVPVPATHPVAEALPFLGVVDETAFDNALRLGAGIVGRPTAGALSWSPRVPQLDEAEVGGALAGAGARWWGLVLGATPDDAPPGFVANLVAM